jgi:hypothetical protein
MKQPINHAVSVWAGGRKRNLYRPKPSSCFYVRFQVRGKDIERSTGTTAEAAAKHRAKEIVEAEIAGNMRELKMRSDDCTWRQLCDRVSALEKIVRQKGGAK